MAEDDDELSDEEEEMDATDGEQMEEEAVAHDLESGDHSFLTSVLESFMEKVSFLKSREGRAGLIHNFLRGLQLMTAPVPKGETLMLFTNIFSFLYFAWKKGKIHGDEVRANCCFLLHKTEITELINSFKLP